MRYLALTLLALTLLAGTGCGGSPPAVSEPERIEELLEGPLEESRVTVNVEEGYYPVYGASTQELAASMTESMRDAWAYCYWGVEWSFEARRILGAWVTGPIEVTVSAAYTMPQWDPPAGTDPALAAEWERFLTALWVHERGHEDNARQAGDATLEALKELPPRPSSRKLDEAADSAAREALQVYWEKDSEYDSVTGHGLTQGAALQPP